MDTKLTLKLNQEIIEKAKVYAAQKKMSLSRIIENYLNSLTNDAKSDDSIEISPFVKSISTGNKISADLDYKKGYAERLLNKHK
jgi:effector-binding domain-containing protein